MSFIKIGESIEISRVENTESCVLAVSEEVLENFRKTAANLKKIAPKADDFLYFSAVMMHAAEAAALNEDGTPKLNSRGDVVKVGWDNSNGTWKWITNDSSIKPYKNCFVPGTKITMDDGSVKNIEDVEPGDMVITHKGNAKKVLKKFITPHEGTILEIQASNNEKISCTDNHPILVLRQNNVDKAGKRFIENKKFDVKFVEAKDIKTGDQLLTPCIYKFVESGLSEADARLVGLFAAEGSYSKRDGKLTGICFTFSFKELDTLVEETKKLLEDKFNCSVHISSNEELGRSDVRVYKSEVADYFYKYVGEYSLTKKLSSEIVFAQDNIKKAFIAGWMDGDGSIDKDIGRVVGTTVSPHLAYQVSLMLNSLKYNHALYKDQPSEHIQKRSNRIIKSSGAYRVRIPYNDAKDIIALSSKLQFNKDVLDRKNISYTDEHRLHDFIESKSVDYTGDVYNLEVEDDNSYIANNLAVHNCNGDVFPELELIKAYKKWIHKPLCIDHKSSSVDHTRGFIVDTYYDRNLKRVIALCALDKANYPDLARKVSTGMQTNVSMGTAVGRAICTEDGCHRVARSEADFCNHMKYKTGYGEINVDLNPIELSIVVNGADPRANIKHVIAAANTLNSYIETKEKEFVKASASEEALAQFRTDINAAFDKLEYLKKSNEDTINDLVSNQSSGRLAMDEAEENASLSLSPPHARFASMNENVENINPIDELHDITIEIEAKLNNIKTSLNKLAESKNTQEENMSSKELSKQGYFQGTEEPTPGQVKYPKDPLNEQVRSKEKHMVGQSPFPNVGPVDGMYPGIASVHMSELERKKMLARADAEERAMRRQAAVELAKQALEDKKAYFQNGDDKNPGAPTPGKQKYPVDKGYLARESDKHMVGQKPFPGVGDVDGLHPSPASVDVSDELKRKQMLARANTLHGKFVRASREDGTRDIDNSTWEIKLGDKLLLSASVRELSGGRSEMMYDSINTPEFGKQLLEKVKVHGADKIRNLVKSGQEAAPDMSGPPQTPEAPAPAAPAAPTDLAPMVEDTGGAGDPKDTAIELVGKMVDMSSDLQEAVRALTGEQAEMGEDMATTASDLSGDQLGSLRYDLNTSLTEAISETISDLADHTKELKTIASMYEKGAVTDSNDSLVSVVVEDAINEAKTAIANGLNLMTSFVKYARATKAMVKKAEMEAELQALTHEDESMGDTDLMDLLNSTKDDLEDVSGLMADVDEDEDIDALLRDSDEADTNEACSDETDVDDADTSGADENNLTAKPEELKDLTVKPGTTVQVTASFDSKQGRAALRAKLAADALGKQDDGQLQDMSKAKFSDMLSKSNALADGKTDLGSDLSKIETVSEVNKAMMDLAKASPKVRKEAEAIHKLISEGKLDSADLSALVAEGLDKDAVAYYKKYYAQADGGSEFANELVKEHVKAQLENEVNTYKVKLARAYEVAYDMRDRGLCLDDKVAIASQVEDIMKFSDDNFDTLKQVIARHAPIQKEAGRMAQVGLIGSGEVNTAVGDDWSLLSTALSKTPRRAF